MTGRAEGGASLRIRPGEPADVGRLVDLLAATRPGAWSSGSLGRELERTDGVCFWLEDEGRAVAVGLGRIVLDELHVLEVGTAPERRRQGAGRMVVDALLDSARGHGCAVALLELRESNAAAEALYRASGFMVVGRRPRYYPDGEGAILMTCPLRGSAAPECGSRSRPGAGE